MELQHLKRRIRLRDLETFMAVIETQGVRKAAGRLHLSQPAVSKAIHDLEDALGVKLFERGRRGVQATVYGKELARRSIAVFDELQGALREFDHLADPTAGEVHLGCMETLHAGLVGSTTEQLIERYPRMRIILESGQGNDLITQFLAPRLVDFVVARPASLPLPPDVAGEPLFFDHLRVVVGAESRFAKRRRIGLAELMDETWIFSRNEVSPQSPVVEAFAAAGLPLPSRLVMSGSLNLRLRLLQSGRFVALVPHSLLPFWKPGIVTRQLPIELPAWRTATTIMTLRDRRLSPAAQLFVNTLKTLARPLSK